jgi:hypothetical protein
MEAYVDAAAVRAAANRIAAAGQAINRSAATVLSFDGRYAGRDRFADGTSLHRATAALPADLTSCAQLTHELAVELRSSTDHYGDVEYAAAARIG